MNRFSKLLAFFLLLIISTVIVPKEVIHHCVDHEDTEDIRTVPNAPYSLEDEHQHCEFLKINVPLYHHFTSFVLTVLPFLQKSYSLLSIAPIQAIGIELPALRAPPQNLHS